MAPNSRMSQARGAFLRRVVGLFAGALLLAQTGTVWAAYEPPEDSQAPSNSSLSPSSRYRPPADSAPFDGQNPNTGSSRGVCDDATSENLPLLTLAPQSHVGQSSSQRPTLLWYVPDEQSYPVEVNIYQDDSGQVGQLINSQVMRSSQGIMTSSLSTDHPGLTPGERYIWEVVVRCNPNMPSNSAIARAPIDIVELPANLATQLANASTPSERITIYAQQGLWYDALGEAQSSSSNSNTELLPLLEDLARIEAELNPSLAAHLEQLITTLQGS
ncbi:DUF928 domain-containing protein [Leptolyngbya sp. FACHB-16]|uniref:DUF928 domain-containing protein n=1 Tax=unclassified Leptolyngbya TaxID=2650499 RepID=UPI001681C51B|nr:DUF928 domain-containing protein [Leptolyngbya sp. FACHB-16]MBD2153697.1 DUF928 domain-containing protein [Leptolyngbya sp. FACHB-16]